MTNGGKTGFCGKQRREQWLDVGGREAGTTQSPSRETPWQSCRCESKPRQVLPEGMPPASITQSSDPSLPHSGPWTAAHGDTTAAGFSRHGATARRGRKEHEGGVLAPGPPRWRPLSGGPGLHGSLPPGCMPPPSLGARGDGLSVAAGPSSSRCPRAPLKLAHAIVVSAFACNLYLGPLTLGVSCNSCWDSE